MEHIHTLRERFILNGRWQFDVEQDQISDLQGRAASVTLQPVATRVLALLAHESQTLVRRRHLFDQGWRRYGFEVCDNSLSQVIHNLRSVFETLDPGRPYIKTVPRIGYCLLAAVRQGCAEVQVTAPSGVHPVTPAEEPSLPAQNDALTGLPSRSGFDRMIEGQWRHARRSCLPLSLLLISVIDLPQLNARYGHKVGDAALAAISRSIKAHIHRAGDYVARYGSVEFAVVLPETQADGAARVAQAIRASVKALEWYDMISVTDTAPVVTLNIGVACTASSDFSTVDALVNAAAEARLSMQHPAAAGRPVPDGATSARSVSRPAQASGYPACANSKPRGP